MHDGAGFFEKFAFEFVGDLAVDPDGGAALAEADFFFLDADAAAGVAAGVVFGDDHAGADGGVGEAVDDDEGAGGSVGFVGVEDEGLGEGEDDAADFVEAQAAGGAFFEGVDVDSVFQFGHGAGDDTGGLFEPVAFAGDEGLFVHPDDHGVDVGGDLGDGVGAFRFCVDEHVAAGDVDFVFEGDGDAHGGEGFVQFSVEGDNGFDDAGFSGGEDSYGV